MFSREIGEKLNTDEIEEYFNEKQQLVKKCLIEWNKKACYKSVVNA